MQDLRSQFSEKNRNRRGEETDAFIVLLLLSNNLILNRNQTTKLQLQLPRMLTGI